MILAIAALAAACSPAPTPSPSGLASQGPTASPVATPSGQPVASGDPAPTQTPTPVPEDTTAWARVTLPDATPVARLEPTQSGAAGIPTRAGFRLTSLDGTPPADLADRLRVEPQVRLTIASTNGATALLRPAAALRPGTLYRFSLLRADGTVETTWAAQTAGPLHVIETIPGDEATRVPRDTGIELVFDQMGVASSDLREHFVISPATAGTFATAGRSIAFVPARPLRRGTLYTVKVTRGLPLAGTGQRLEDDVVVRFETAAADQPNTAIGLQRQFIESSPRDAAAMSLWVDVPDEGHPPARVPLTVHRLAGLSEAESAWRAVRDAPMWTRVTTTPTVPTAGLPQVIDTRVQVRGEEGSYWIRLPRPLARGWYLVTVAWAGIPRQAVLQVTDIATYTMVTTTRSIVWVNNLRTARPIAGATVSLGGRGLGTSDARGLVTARTPQPILQANRQAPILLEVREGGRVAFQPVQSSWYQYCLACADDGADNYWHLLSSDRYRYRSTDTINAWGVVRNRDTDAVPASLRVSLWEGGAEETTAVPISTVAVSPDANGAFAAEVPLRGLPAGDYRLTVRAGNVSVGELWFAVGTITKPAYRLAIALNRHAVVSGGSVTASIHGSFFEGTPVAGTSLMLEPEEGQPAEARTDSNGDASAQLRLNHGYDEQWTVQSIQVTPKLPEEAELAHYAQVAVFKGHALVDANGAVAGRRLTVTGRVTGLALGRFETVDPDELWEVDPHGDGIANALASVGVIEHRAIRRQVGSRYDFILKRVVPEYDTVDRTSAVTTRTVVTGANGAFRFVVPVTGGDRDYEIRVRYVDSSGVTLSTDAWANGDHSKYLDSMPSLVSARGDDDDGTYAIGEQVRVRFAGGTNRPRVERYLFAVTQRGLRSVTLTSSPAFRTTFDANDVPGFDISGVRFTGYGYEEAWGYGPRLKLDERRLTIKVTADQARYEPGDTVRLTIRTLDPAGRPVRASVFVQGVDEKLFATGDAGLIDPIDALYSGVGSGILATARSHRTPNDDFEDGKGDTTGGGEGGDARGDFRDWLVGRLISTNASGTATIEMPLSDDLTSWHVTAEGIDGSLRAGAGELLVPVGLPFFAEATIPATFVAADRPIIRVRAFGGGLRNGAAVTFTVSSQTLGLAPVTVTGTAFEAIEVPLGALTVGTHRIRIEASSGTGAAKLHDALDRTVEVLASRTAQLETTWSPLDGPATVATGDGFTRLTLVDAGRGRVVPILQELSTAGTARSDQVLAAGLANRVLDETFGLDAGNASDDDLRRFVTDDGPLAIVPWGSGNLDATALAALADDPRLDPASLHYGLWTVAYDESASRPRRLLALAGLAGLGDTVLSDVRAAAALPDLTVEEEISLSIAALYAGDEDLARSIEHRVLEAHGLHQGPWTRIKMTTANDGAIQTARLAIVAASLGEDVAAEMDAWVAANPPTTTTVVLERALAARGWAARIPGAAASATLTVDGVSRTVHVLPDAPVAIPLTPAQAASAKLEPVSGHVLVVTSRSIPLDPSTLTKPAGVTITRQVVPGLRTGDTATVKVTLLVTLTGKADDGCWRVTELVPSGLMATGAGYRTELGESIGPDRIDGQRVEFCVVRDPQRDSHYLSYVARVVDPGSYAWEPAVLQSSVAPELGLTTPALTMVIDGSAD